METGEVLARPEIDALEEITQSSPGLTEAYVLAPPTDEEAARQNTYC